MGAELFHVDGQTDGQTDRQADKRDIKNSRFPKFCESAKNEIPARHESSYRPKHAIVKCVDLSRI